MVMSKQFLTSDKWYFMALLFGSAAGFVLVVTSVRALKTFETFRALDRGAPTVAVRCSPGIPSVCEEYDVTPNLPHVLGTTGGLIAAAALLWMIGFRHRTVWLEGDNVLITWGKRLPIPLRRYPAAKLKDFEIKKELRYAVSRIRGTNVNRVSRAPDRWRLTVHLDNTRMSLGSYLSQQAAQEAQQMIVSVGTSYAPESR
jgi:hypothetical protein